jgi:hypothetical protein
MFISYLQTIFIMKKLYIIFGFLVTFLVIFLIANHLMHLYYKDKVNISFNSNLTSAVYNSYNSSSGAANNPSSVPATNSSGGMQNMMSASIKWMVVNGCLNQARAYDFECSMHCIQYIFISNTAKDTCMQNCHDLYALAKGICYKLVGQ